MRSRWRGAGSFALRWVLDHPIDMALLTALVGTVFAFRFLILQEIPYPPSADAAGDLVWLHTYLGSPLPGYGLVEAPPPVYFFAVVDPAIHLAGVFLGIQLIMALVPALMAIPAYAFVRWAGHGPAPASLAGALISGSAAFSDMVTWNSAFNATGILFLLAFLAVVVRGATRPTTRWVLVGGLFLALAAGSHIVTFLFALATVVVFVVIATIDRSALARRTRRFALRATVAGLVFAIPFAPAYYNNFFITANVGPPSSGTSWSQLAYVYGQWFGFPWGSYSPVPPPTLFGAIVVVDIVATVVALPLVWRWSGSRTVAGLTTSVFLAALGIAALDPGNAIRAVYFLPLAYVPAVVIVADNWYARRPARATTIDTSRPGEGIRFGRNSPIRELAFPLAALFVAANLAVSGVNMQQAERFYLELTPAKVAALDWIRTNTSSSARFYDAANLQTWLLGYAQRLSYFPASLNTRVTQSSYQTAFESNLIDMGAYVAGNSQLYVTSNAPGVYNSPGIFVRTQDFRDPIWLGQSDRTVVTVLNGSVPHRITMNYGQRVNVSGGVDPNGTVSMTTFSAFPSDRLAIVETIDLAGPRVTIGFSTPTVGCHVANVSLDFRTPPSGYFYDYSPFRPTTVTGTMHQVLQLPYLGPVTVDTSSPGMVAQVATESTGWSSLNVSAPGPVTFTLGGWTGVAGGVPFFSNTLAVARSLEIGYFIVSDQTDYPLYERLFATTSQGYLVLPDVFHRADLHILEVE